MALPRSLDHPGCRIYTSLSDATFHQAIMQGYKGGRQRLGDGHDVPAEDFWIVIMNTIGRISTYGCYCCRLWPKFQRPGYGRLS